MVSPEERLSNLLYALRDVLERKPYAGQKADALTILAQLESHWQAYQAGTLAPLDTGGLPF